MFYCSLIGRRSGRDAVGSRSVPGAADAPDGDHRRVPPGSRGPSGGAQGPDLRPHRHQRRGRAQEDRPELHRDQVPQEVVRSTYVKGGVFCFNAFG